MGQAPPDDGEQEGRKRNIHQQRARARPELEQKIDQRIGEVARLDDSRLAGGVRALQQRQNGVGAPPERVGRAGCRERAGEIDQRLRLLPYGGDAVQVEGAGKEGRAAESGMEDEVDLAGRRRHSLDQAGHRRLGARHVGPDEPCVEERQSALRGPRQAHELDRLEIVGHAVRQPGRIGEMGGRAGAPSVVPLVHLRPIDESVAGGHGGLPGRGRKPKARRGTGSSAAW